MSFPRYPKYKPSGVEWLGDVPEHWDVLTVRRIAKSVQTGGTPTSISPNADLEEGMVWYTPGDFTDSLLLTDSVRKLAPDVVAAGDAKLFPANSVLIVSIGATLGKVGYVKETSSANQQINAIVPNERIGGHFLAYSLSVKSEVMHFLSNASTIGIMNQEKTKEIWLAVPRQAEQTAIAAFLDRETLKIDSLVAEQRRLIELLKEKRQAVISHAVTKGLNPHARTKPSGIEWLGDVPEHWEVLRLKQISKTITDGEHISPSTVDEGVPLLSAKDVRDWRIDYEVDKYVSPSDAAQFWNRCNPERGDVLIVSRGATVGRVGVVEDDLKFCLMGSVILCKPQPEYDSAFLYFALNAKHAQTSLWFSSASSAQQAIYIRDVAEVPVPVPPHDERVAIAAFLKTETAKLGTLTAEAQRGIELLQERRTALISAAVTGKIDVREFARGSAEHSTNR